MRNAVSPPPARRRGRKVLVTFLVLVLALVLLVGGAVAYLVAGIGGDVPRIPDAFRGLKATERS